MSAAGLALVYHRIADLPDDLFGMAVSPGNFREQMEVVARLRPLALEDAARGMREGRLPDGAVVVTFDDGYRDNVRRGVPVLEDLGIPATVFVTTGATDTRRAFWWDDLLDLVRRAPAGAGPAELRTGPATLRVRTDGPQGRAGAVWELWAALRRLPVAEIERALGGLRGWAGRPGPLEYDDDARVMTRAELAELHASPVIVVGAHTVTHPMLGARTPEEQLAELRGSRDRLEEWLGAPVRTLAYPYGRPRVEYTAVTTRAAREAGFELACSVSAGELTRATRMLEIPRWTAPDVGGEAFERRLRERLRRPSPAARVRRAIGARLSDRRAP